MLEKYRKKIDSVDRKIVKILARRCAITKKIGDYKKKEGIKTKDTGREKEMMANLALLAKKYDLPVTKVKTVFKEILQLSYHSQK